MKYTIVINQKAWKSLYPDAQANDAIVFDAIKSICNAKSDNIIRTADGYTWISLKLISEEMPMLGITSKSTISGYISKLELWGLIFTKKIEQKLYVKLSPKSDLLERDRELNNREDVKDQPFENSNSRPKIEQPSEITNDTVRKFEQNRSKIRTDHIYYNQITKDQKENIVASENEATASPEKVLKICPKCKSKPVLLEANNHFHCPECLRNYDQDLKVIKAKIEKEAPDPRVKEILTFHYENNPEKSDTGIENWGRDSKLIKNLIGQFRPEKQPEAKEIVITYLKNYYTFQFYQKVCYSIPAFVNNFKTFRRSEKENERTGSGNTEKFINLRGSWEPTMEGFKWAIEN